jgi:hypothetical protein
VLRRPWADKKDGQAGHQGNSSEGPVTFSRGLTTV